MIIAGIIPTLILTIGLLVSHILSNSENDDGMESPLLFSKAGFRFLFVPRSGIFELAFCCVVMFCHCAAIVYLMHPEVSIPVLVIGALSSLSLFSR